jgi:hypothetical protein
MLIQTVAQGAAVAQWNVFETSFESAKVYSNAFMEVEVDVVFQQGECGPYPDENFFAPSLENEGGQPYPVIWILAGEIADETKWGQGPWAEVAKYVREIDPCQHPLTCHTGQGRRGATGCFAAGIPGEVRFIYLPRRSIYNWEGPEVKGLEPDIAWHVYYFDPATGRKFDQGTIKATTKAGDKEAKPVSFKKNVPSPQDWVLVFERIAN